MLARIDNGEVVEYPFTLAQLYAAHSNTSFPPHMTDEVLAEQGIVRVVLTGAPDYDPETHSCTEVDPVFNVERNRWEQSFNVVPL